MLRRTAFVVAACAMIAAAGCGGGDELSADAYTCGQFKKSLDTKDDRSAGTYIRLLNDRAKTGGRRSDQEKLMAYAIFVACRGEKASYKPAKEAVANAKAIKAGKRVVPEDVAERERKKAAEAEKKADE